MILSTHGVIASQIQSFVGLLDTYPNAAAAYSVRKLRAAYTGSAIRVRRSSDNTEQDIGFSGANLDTTALTSFCSGTNGFVTTWYDQSGNANNATQSTAANQPQIVSSGSIITQGTKPTLQSNGSSQFLSTTGTAFSSIQTTLIAVNKQSSIFAGYKRLLCIGAYNDGYHMGSNPATDDMLAIFNSSPFTCFGGTSISYNVSIAYNNATTGFLVNNGTQVNSITTTVSSYGSENLFIANDKSGNPTDIWNGVFQEIIVYPSSQSSNLSGINTNINTYYGIY
jgi:hypothetical protein